MSVQPNKTTAKEFSVHPAMIYSLITKQASGAPKALLELIMNSVDAGATRIDVTMNPTGYVIADNGKGFKDADEITSFFGTFGTPHAAGDAFYGRFRLGRAQSFGISRTKWFSKDFCMEVDLKVELDEDDKEAPLGYKVSQGHPFYDGCRIVGEFYNEQNVGSVKDFYTASIGERPEQMPIIPALIKMIRYIPCDVFINNEKVNLSVEESAVSHLTDSAHFILNKVSGSNSNIVNVYNKGVYAYQLNSYYYTGDVVSFEALDLNIARNEAKHTCAIAKKIRNKLKALDVAVDTQDSKQTKQREKPVDQKVFIDGLWEIMLGMKGFEYESFQSMVERKVISLANDKKLSLRQVVNALRKKRTLLEGVVKGDMLFYSNQSLGLDGNTLDLMGIENGFLPIELFPSEELLNKLNYEVKTLPNNCFDSYYDGNPVGQRSVCYQDYVKYHCFDFTETKKVEEKLKLLIGLLLSVFYAVDRGHIRRDGLLGFTPFHGRGYTQSEYPLNCLDFNMIDVNSLSEGVLGERVEKMVDHNVKLDAIETMVMASLTTNYNINLLGRSRKLNVVSTNEETLAFTDGNTSIYFNHSFLKECIAKGDFENLVRVLIHEMCHNSSSLGKASHGATFYAEYARYMAKAFMPIMIDFYNLLGQKIEKRVETKGTEWLKEQMPVAVIAKVAKHRFDNKVRAFG